MNKKGIVVFLVASVACITFLGCASVPKEELDEKEAIIRNLNTEIAGFKQDISKLQSANEELAASRSDLEEKISRLENELSAKQKAAEEPTEPKIK